MERNTILQGDCLDLMRDVPSGSVDMILCDLPYGGGITACKWDTAIPFPPLWEQYERIIKPNGAIVLTGSQPFTTDLISSNRRLFRYEMIWEKQNGTNFHHANKMPIRCHENILVFYKRLPTYNPQKTQGAPYSDKRKEGSTSGNTVVVKNRRRSGSPDGLRFPRSVMKVDYEGARFNSRNATQKRHPTQKPVALFELLIRTYTNPGELVMDNTAGSGTTAVACINSGRDYLLMEREAKFVEECHRRVAEARAALPLFAHLETV